MKGQRAGRLLLTLGEKNSYQVTTNQSPSITGTIADTYYPDKVDMAVYKENYFLGVLTSTELITTRTQSLSNTNSTSLSFSAPVSQTLDYGSYHIDITGSDKAGNKSGTSTLYFKVMTSGQARELLQGKITEEEKETIQEQAQVSLPALEKKAILRREKEAGELEKAIAPLSVIPDLIRNLYKSSEGFLAMTNGWNESETRAREQIAHFYQNAPKAIALGNILKPFKDATTATGKTLTKLIAQANRGTTEKLSASGQALNLAWHAIVDPAEKETTPLGRVANGAKVALSTFQAYVFDNNPTKITDVAIEEVGKDYEFKLW